MSRRRGAPGAPPLLLYDGVCALCNGAVRFVLRRDRQGAIRFAPLQGPTAAAVIARHPHLEGVDSMVWVGAAGEVSVRSDAALAVGRYLGGPWRWLAAAASLVPRPLRDGLYDLVARRRYRLFGRYDACPVPPPEQRARFLE
ncbi:MAG: DCC1-like thiol-disulfide oxidoreductase family protein [Gemmatimonadota bacterium]